MENKNEKMELNEEAVNEVSGGVIPVKGNLGYIYCAVPVENLDAEMALINPDTANGQALGTQGDICLTTYKF